jgi:hypothetical protein
LVVVKLFEDLSSSRQPIVCSQPVNNYVIVFRTADMADNQCFADSQMSVPKLNAYVNMFRTAALADNQCLQAARCPFQN